MNNKNPKVDFFFEKSGKWQDEFSLLREIILECGLAEELKWGVPCYTLRKKNIVLIHGFKEYCALLFHKGVFLKDPDHLLIQQTENVQAARQIRFTEVGEIKKLRKLLKSYIHEAIEVEKAGLKVKMKESADLEIPKELQEAFDQNPDLKKAFYSLTPGRQRGYILYFSGAKQTGTRKARIEKYRSHIFRGKGLREE